MALQKFNDFAKDFNNENKIVNSPLKKVNETAFIVGDTYKVKVVIDVPQNLVDEYIDKVKKETNKDPLDNFSQAEIAEQIIQFIIKKNLMLDNLSPEFTVGSDNIDTTDKSKETIKSDAEKLENDLDIEEQPDKEIEFKDYNEKDDNNSDGEIEFSEEKEEKKLAEERKVETPKKSNFDEIEFDFDEETQNPIDKKEKSKTVGELKKKLGIIPNEKEKPVEEFEEEVSVDDLYKKLGYKVGYFENLNINKIFKI